MHTICLVTCQKASRLTPSDQLFYEALVTAGWRVEIAPWDDPAVEWDSFRAVVLRATWDYHLRPQEFRNWLDHCRTIDARLYNPPELVDWNIHKAYLVDLAKQGIPVVPTQILQQNKRYDLASLLEAKDWHEVVIKPAISATAHQTFRASRADVGAASARLQGYLKDADFLVQPFVPEITLAGEFSFQFFNGEFSHAVLKQAQPGDFRVQGDFGGSIQPFTPSQPFLAQVTHVADTITQPWLYARIDGVDVEGDFVVMEVELIEPELFLEQKAGAAEKMARALRKLITTLSPPHSAAQDTNHG